MDINTLKSRMDKISLKSAKKLDPPRLLKMANRYCRKMKGDGKPNQPLYVFLEECYELIELLTPYTDLIDTYPTIEMIMQKDMWEIGKISGFDEIREVINGDTLLHILEECADVYYTLYYVYITFGVRDLDKDLPEMYGCSCGNFNMGVQVNDQFELEPNCVRRTKIKDMIPAMCQACQQITKYLRNGEFSHKKDKESLFRRLSYIRLSIENLVNFSLGESDTFTIIRKVKYDRCLEIVMED